jgi:hypothetical protein
MSASPLRYSLLGDGASDETLLHPIMWLFERLGSPEAIGQWADLRWLRPPPIKLTDRISAACEHFPCDLLFVHRDAERATRDDRRFEIEAALGAARTTAVVVCVVPMRSTEAWLLHDSRAIRHAAGNPKGTTELGLPRTTELESLVDPKACLRDALLAALPDRARERARVARDFGVMRRRVAELADYETLLRVAAFDELRRDLEATLSRLQ